MRLLKQSWMKDKEKKNLEVILILFQQKIKYDVTQLWTNILHEL